MRLRTEPPYAERHVRWCERAVHSALLDLIDHITQPVERRKYLMEAVYVDI